jgi:hypothetical protein
MANKKIFGGILAVALVFGLALLGCASAPEAVPLVSVGAEALAGKTAVIIPLTMASRAEPKESDTSVTGIPGMIQNAAVVSSWVKAFDDVAKRNGAEITAKLKEAYESFVGAYKTAYSAAVAEAAFDFGKNEPAFGFFAKPDKNTVTKITQLCAANNAEYAITLLYRITDGSVVSTMASANTSAITAVIVIFDKTGNIVAIKEGRTPEETFRFVYARGTSEDEINSGLNQSMLNLYDSFKSVLSGFAEGVTTPSAR